MEESNIKIHILNTSNKIKNPLEIEDIIKETVNKIIKLIRIKNLDIVVRYKSEFTIPEIGIGGDTLDPNTTNIYLSSNISNLAESLKSTLTHELHHAARWQSIGYGETLLEALVSEGLADYFDIEINKRKPNLWMNAFSDKDLNEFSKKAKLEYENTKYNHAEWFLGYGKLPRWIGYSIGYKIIGDYLKRNPSKNSLSIYYLPAKEFITP